MKATDYKQYRVNEIFYSLQGEGHYAGTPAIFVRFSGCNLHCPFCDTDFASHTLMNGREIVKKAKQLAPKAPLVVFTGGEPTLQLDPDIVELFHREDYKVAIETNGTRQPPYNVDWITLSPKGAYLGKEAFMNYIFANELKIVFDGEHEVDDFAVGAQYYWLQPCDTGDEKRNREIIAKCIEYIKQNPQWRLSLQTQKIVDIR